MSVWGGGERVGGAEAGGWARGANERLQRSLCELRGCGCIRVGVMVECA